MLNSTATKTMLTIVKLLIYYFAYQLGFQAIALVAARHVSPMDPSMALSLAMVVSTAVMTWHLIHFGYIRLTRNLFKGVSVSILAASVVLVSSGTYVLNLLIEQADIPYTTEEIFLGMSRNPFGVLSIALMGPILEELLFRGVIQRRIQAMTHKAWVAIIASALIFGVVHGNQAQIIFASLMGLMFGWLYYRTGSLLPSIVGHVVNNSVAAINMILYGNTTIEEQMNGPLAMWLWAAVAIVICCIAAGWLNRKLTR